MTKDERISLRVDAKTKRLLEAASEEVGMSASAFILNAATLAAHHTLADRTVFRLNAEQWAAFDAMLNEPARDVPGLRELLNTPTILDELE
ncbi:DUF1778 domain-containing protein [Planomonospora sp. ID67723]|uniref:type II toxin-antitoxin system TacA family antitoxin n=1 Tax=Planomonospora sp. ID67723 TaxID=2738134 RepID=UPI0018C3BE60|nr:DUF1778 domain-containing protein [Planomonospora sp. ID67723]MBG0827219.1 DUF1778 domain-containing protein [Planomonospora sp. ID67723]